MWTWFDPKNSTEPVSAISVFPPQMHVERPFHHDHDLLVLVPVRRMRLHAGAEHRLVHLDVEPGVVRAAKELPALLPLIAAIRDLARMVHLRRRDPHGGTLLRGGQGGQESQIPA